MGVGWRPAPTPLSALPDRRSGPLTPLDRVCLVFGLAWRREGFIDAGLLAPLAGGKEVGRAAVATSLIRLQKRGLVEISARGTRFRFRRTPHGAAEAERLLGDSRISFLKAVNGP